MIMGMTCRYSPLVAHLVVLCTLAASMASTAAHAESPAAAAVPAEGIVDLRFAWPVGLHAQVKHTKSRSRTVDGNTLSAGATTRFDLDVSASKDGTLLVSPSRVSIEPSAGSELPPAERLQLELMARSALPTFVVSSQGEFTGIHDLPRFREGVRRALGSLLPPSQVSAPLQELMDQLTSEAVLTGLVAGDWSLQVGYWLDASLKLDAEYESSELAPFPLVPGAQVKMNTRFIAKRTLPCERAAQSRTCVELELHSTPDGEDMARAMHEFLSNAAPKLGGQSVLQDIDIEQTLLLRTEARSLIPHHYVLSKRITAKAGVNGGPGKVSEEVQSTQVVYTY